MNPRPTVRTQAELLDLWRHLLHPLGFSGGSLWMLAIDADRRAGPGVVELADADEPPTAHRADGFAELLRLLAEDLPGGSFAFLRSRPGRGGVTDEDRAWAVFLHDAGRVAGVTLEVVHLATDVDVVPLPLDEIGLGRPA